MKKHIKHILESFFDDEDNFDTEIELSNHNYVAEILKDTVEPAMILFSNDKGLYKIKPLIYKVMRELLTEGFYPIALSFEVNEKCMKFILLRPLTNTNIYNNSPYFTYKDAEKAVDGYRLWLGEVWHLINKEDVSLLQKYKSDFFDAIDIIYNINPKYIESWTSIKQGSYNIKIKYGKISNIHTYAKVGFKSLSACEVYPILEINFDDKELISRFLLK